MWNCQKECRVMGETVIGTTNLAPKRRIQQIMPGVKFPDRWLAVDTDGTFIWIHPNGTVMSGAKEEGAYQSCRKDGHLLIFQYGVLAFSEDELF
jgi:hypothetical protein